MSRTQIIIFPSTSRLLFFTSKRDKTKQKKNPNHCKAKTFVGLLRIKIVVLHQNYFQQSVFTKILHLYLKL